MTSQGSNGTAREMCHICCNTLICGRRDEITYLRYASSVKLVVVVMEAAGAAAVAESDVAAQG